MEPHRVSQWDLRQDSEMTCGDQSQSQQKKTDTIDPTTQFTSSKRNTDVRRKRTRKQRWKDKKRKNTDTDPADIPATMKKPKVTLTPGRGVQAQSVSSNWRR